MHIDFVEIGNFRKLLGVRIGIAEKRTVFVGANNSGKTSAMVALRYFLLEGERRNFSLTDFTLSHWPQIDAMGKSWEASKTAAAELPAPDWSSVVPFVDLWLQVPKPQAHLVQKIIPTLEWEGGLLGVRLRFEPRDAFALQADYLAAREHALKTQLSDEEKGKEGTAIDAIQLWPRSLTEYLLRRLNRTFEVKAYILDPTKAVEPRHGIAQPQALSSDATPIEGDPLKGLIKINEVGAQRGFGQAGNSKDDDDNYNLGAPGTRKLSNQFRQYWNQHLDPYENPGPQDLLALKAIESAQHAFDDRLKAGFQPSLDEMQGLGYPGVTDPQLQISTRLRPVDGLNHEAAVQYMVQMEDGTNKINLSLPEDSNGLGYQNLISMVFRLMSFRDSWLRLGKATPKATPETEDRLAPLHLVLIEEPEAHLHTQVQQVFIRNAFGILRKRPELKDNQELTTQLLISTHSSHVANECEFDELRYFRRLPSKQKSVPTSCVVDLSRVFEPADNTKRFVARYLRVTHCDLLFADAAVLVEGVAEEILCPHFIAHDEDLKVVADSYVTWLPLGGSHAHRFRLLIEKLGLTTLIITDLDAKTEGGDKAVPLRASKLKSRNATLAKWWPEKDDLDFLLDMKAEDKVRPYEEQGFSMRVAYQSPITVEFRGASVEALSNTFEDALVLTNLAYFAASTKAGPFKRFKTSITDSPDIASLSTALFKDVDSITKAEFALDLLEIEDPKAIKPPVYIKEALLWLSGQLRKQHKDLGVATTKESEAKKAAA
ncbi:AAA family ATPase [Dongia sp. agr-C8]